MGALPESNLYDALDLDAIEANAQTELDSAVAEARLLIENLADEVGVEVDGLETQVAVLETSVVVSSAYVGKADGKRGAAVSPPRASTDDADDE
jgi:hypothetical protein